MPTLTLTSIYTTAVLTNPDLGPALGTITLDLSALPVGCTVTSVTAIYNTDPANMLDSAGTLEVSDHDSGDFLHGPIIWNAPDRSFISANAGSIVTYDIELSSLSGGWVGGSEGDTATLVLYSLAIVYTGGGSGSPPAAPTGLTTSPGVGTPTEGWGSGVSSGTCTGDQPSVTVVWNAVTGATSYKLYRDGVLIYTGATTSYTDSTITGGSSYSYTVKATNASGDSAASSALVIAVPALSCAFPPTISTDPFLVLCNNRIPYIVLSWSAVAGATAYKLYRNDLLLYTGSLATFTDAGILQGGAYSYVVRAISGGVDGSPSAPFILNVPIDACLHSPPPILPPVFNPVVEGDWNSRCDSGVNEGDWDKCSSDIIETEWRAKNASTAKWQRRW